MSGHRHIGVLALAIGIIASATSFGAADGFKLRAEEQEVNAGGHPFNGVMLVSPNFRITLGSIGDAAAGRLDGPGYRICGGFPSLFSAPGEVTALMLTDATSLSWRIEPSAGSYNLYRGVLSSGPGTDSCLQADIGVEHTQDPALPPVSKGFSYLVTSCNRLSEEGTKGFDSTGAERPNSSPCP